MYRKIWKNREDFSEDSGERTKARVGIQGGREVFFKIYQNKYCRHANENILFWKKYSQMTEFCKFPRDIRRKKTEKWKNVLPNIFGGVIGRGVNF